MVNVAELWPDDGYPSDYVCEIMNDDGGFVDPDGHYHCWRTSEVELEAESEPEQELAEQEAEPETEESAQAEQEADQQPAPEVDQPHLSNQTQTMHRKVRGRAGSGDGGHTGCLR